MTDGGCIASRRELPREIRDDPPLSLPSALATWRGGVTLEQASCLALFGVGPETLQRIERGEVIPEPETEERIRLVLSTWNNSSAAFARSAAEPPGDAPFGAGAGEGRCTNGGRAYPSALSRAAPQPRPGFALHKREDGEREIHMLFRGEVEPIALDAARAMSRQLAGLLAFHDDPALFEKLGDQRP